MNNWMRVIDESMVMHDIGIADPEDDYETAKSKLNKLLCINQSIGEYFAGKDAMLSAFKKILYFSDLEMYDGDAARKVAKNILKEYDKEWVNESN